MTNPVEPFTLAIPQADLDDLHTRLRRTRWPEAETVADRSQGLKLDAARALYDHWLHRYDWRRCEVMLNGFGQYRTAIDGLDIHFLHARSPEPEALPLIITHGWPGSVVEFHKIIGPLTDPRAHGGDPRDAFHVVAPSLPGYGFSGKPAATGWTTWRTADAWIELMRRLGYERWVAQGGDWGSAVTTRLALRRPPGLAAIHLNAVVVNPPSEDMLPLMAEEQSAIDEFAAFNRTGSGYSAIQSTRPQTIGYGLADSPMGQAGWILEKFIDHMDCGGDPLSVLSWDELLDNIMLYWLPGSGASSARLYWESLADFVTPDVIDLPTGCSIFPVEMMRPSRRWADRKYSNIIHWNVLDRGGHFAAFEQPELFVRELRDSFRSLR